MESGVHPSSYPNYHHQIIFAKFNLKIFYSPLYKRVNWHYQRANADHIRRAINELARDRSFANKNANEKVLLFNKTLNSILSNYIPHETIFCDDRDPPLMMKKILKIQFMIKYII